MIWLHFLVWIIFLFFILSHCIYINSIYSNELIDDECIPCRILGKDVAHTFFFFLQEPREEWFGSEDRLMTPLNGEAKDLHNYLNTQRATQEIADGTYFGFSW